MKQKTEKMLGEEIFVALLMKIGDMLPSQLLCLHI